MIQNITLETLERYLKFGVQSKEINFPSRLQQIPVLKQGFLFFNDYAHDSGLFLFQLLVYEYNYQRLWLQ
jgi:hypothetical protein